MKTNNQSQTIYLHEVTHKDGHTYHVISDNRMDTQPNYKIIDQQNVTFQLPVVEEAV